MKFILSLLVVLLISQSTTICQTFDTRDNWFGKYNGNTSASKKWLASHYGNNPQFRFGIYDREKFFVNTGYGAGYYSCEIWLPDDYKEINGLNISSNQIRFSPTRKYPFRIELRKGKDQYGDIELTGVVEVYKVQPNGDLTLRQKFHSFHLYGQ